MVVGLHAAETHLGQMISDEEIKKGKLTELLTEEDLNVPAQVSICYSYLWT